MHSRWARRRASWDEGSNDGLDSDINMTHERFVAAMQSRLPAMPLEQKERYFAVLSNLVGKLEIPDKRLGEIGSPSVRVESYGK